MDVQLRMSQEQEFSSAMESNVLVLTAQVGLEV